MSLDYIQKYSRQFYLGDTFKIAKKLLGSYLCTNIDNQLTTGLIVEVEPYIGGTDKASHSYLGKRTARTEVQFGQGGYAYTFFVYGMYSQFCVVTGPKNVSDVVLIRAVEPVEGIEVMKQRRGKEGISELTNGPGKLCMALGITKKDYGRDLCGNKIWICPSEKPIELKKIVCAKRIGIDYAGEYADKLWRFYIGGNSFVSRKC